jgi:uncharacterized repeat protein (TIGR01451 family)
MAIMRNEKIVFLVFAFVLMSWGQASADFTFNYVSNDGTVNISGLLNTASTGNGTLPVTGGYFSGFENGLAISGTILGGVTNPPNTLTSPSGKFVYDNSLIVGSGGPLLSTSGGLLFGNTSTNTETNIFYYNGAYSFSTYNPGTGYQPDPSGWGIPGNFTVSPAFPNLSILKSANRLSAAPGDVITYSALVTNTGIGTATIVVISDTLSPYAWWGVNSYGAGIAFQFTNGSPTSGLTLGTPVYSNDGGTTWVYTPVSGGGGAPAGYDGNVTNFSIPMTGTMNASGANFTINYQVRVK